MTITVKVVDPMQADVAALVLAHNVFCDGTAPAESCHNLPVEGLRHADVTLWGAYEGDALLAMGALKLLGDGAGEVKSMHTAQSARGRGLGRVMLRQVIGAAQDAGLHSLWLETGAQDDFIPSRSLYESVGFQLTGPFADYKDDPNSCYYTLDLVREGVG
jgi:putative acetyltransferase